MTWIKTKNFKEDKELQEALSSPFIGQLPVEYETRMEMFSEYEVDGEPAAVVMAQSLIPESLKHVIAAYRALLSPELPLSRREHELIAAVVSTINKTHYCRNSHAFFLKLATGDEKLATTIRDNYRAAELSDKERAMVDYAAKLTETPECVNEDDIIQLRKVGFDDQAILQINMIAAQFNYWNRIADGLGVGRSKTVKQPSMASR